MPAHHVELRQFVRISLKFRADGMQQATDKRNRLSPQYENADGYQAKEAWQDAGKHEELSHSLHLSFVV